MKIRIAGLFVIALVTAGPGHAQQTTEVYIPIGESPGISADESWIGEIEAVDYSEMKLEVDTSRGMRTVKVDDRTRFYLDRSDYRKQNVYGDMRDCRVGRRVEVYVDEEGTARWIKIRSE
ncbi:MAG: hypothetical protein R3288_11130 [Woeseiaceae bacterium]|nr:hypothetical protein [Woeseiaceae bacterium]